ncbi:MAG: hypothetical protein ABIR67_09150 [Gaiellaceae bacterium]
MRRIIAVAACVAAVATVGAGSAFAGETTGNFQKTGKETPIGAAPENAPHASSICSFSGQNPELFLTGDAFEPGRTQSWGQIPKAVRDEIRPFAHPGISCNGHTGFFSG